MSGIIDVSRLGTPPEKHEMETARVFADLGKNVTFIRPSSIPNVHSPDILMDGIEWEMKSPTGSSKRTIEICFRKAVKQSNNLIFDLRKIHLPEKQCISQLEKEFNVRSCVRKMYVIKKDGSLIKYSK